MSSNPLNISDNLHQELKIVEERVLSKAKQIFKDIEVSPLAINYISRLGQYPRQCYFSTFWVKDSDMRLSIGEHIGLHAISMCFLDDIMDDDTPVSNMEKTLGVYFSQYAVSQLCQYNNPVKIVEAINDDYKKMWHAQLKEIHSPQTNMDEWLKIARTKTGLFMGCYAEIACLASNNIESIENARKIMEAASILAQFKDDFEDFVRPEERDGNLLNIFHNTSYKKKTVIEFIKHWENVGLTEIDKGYIAVSDFKQLFLFMSKKCFNYVESHKNLFT